MTRVKAAGDTTNDGVAPGATYPKVCQNGSLSPNPQLAFTYRVSDRIGIGVALLAPSAVGSASWPELQNGVPAPQRYLLVSTSSIVLVPTVGFGAEIVDHLRIGASLIFGTAPSLDLVAASPATTGPNDAPSTNDIRTELQGQGHPLARASPSAPY